MHMLAAGQFPDQPGIDGAKEQIARLGPRPNAGHVIQNPGDLGAGEISVQQQSGAVDDFFVVPGRAKLVAGFRRAPILPDDGVIDGVARLAIPNDGRFPLVGDAQRPRCRSGGCGRGPALPPRR